MFLAPSFLKGDANQDGKLSQAEFAALGEKWFAAWDTNHSGRLNEDALRAGLNATLAPPDFGPPGGGRPGGFNGRMNLQGAEGKRNGVAAMAGIEFNYVHADLDFAGHAFKDVANKHVKGQKLSGVTVLNLHNNVTDATEMNEPLAFRLYRDAGVPAPRTAYARVYVTVPGKFARQYFGLYSLVEEVGKGFTEDNFGSNQGAIFKPVTPDLFSDLGNDWARYKQTYDPKGTVSKEQTQRVIEFAQFATKADDQEFAARLGDFIALDEFARYLAVTTFLADLDGILGPGQNFYLYLDPHTSKFSFIAWDQDHSWGQFGMRGTQEQRENLSVLHPWQGENRFLERVLKVETFRKLYLARLEEFSRTIFQPARFEQQVNEFAAAIRPAIAEESPDRIARFDQAVAGKPLESSFGGRGGFGQPTKPIKAFVKIRAQSVSDQVAGKSKGQELEQFGFGGPRGGGGRPGGPGGPGGFGPGNFLAGTWLIALDANKDGTVTQKEFTEAFARWFAAWNTDKSGVLTDEQLRAGIDKDLAPRFDGPPGGRGFGPPGG
jgi:spore coat protein H